MQGGMVVVADGEVKAELALPIAGLMCDLSVREAKAAIAAGIRTLLEVTETSEEEISVFYLAGGFGKHLNLDSALRIGLFPVTLRGKVRVLGNAALRGAASMLTNEAMKETARTVAGEAKYLSLPDNPAFSKNYIEELSF